MASKEKIKKRLKSARPHAVPEEKTTEIEDLSVTEGPNTDNADKEIPKTPKYKKSKTEEISELSKEKGAKEEEQSKEGGKSTLSAPKLKEGRSASPFRRNVVEPVGVGEEGPSAMGSAASLRSTTSSTREAWTDPNESSTSLQKKRPGSGTSGKSTSTIVSKIGRSDTDKTGRKDSGSGRSDSTVAVNGPEQNAYIPYLYARNTIQKITEDMKKMKTNHIRIVYDIERNYKTIEDETQTEFNGFVLRLREQYTGKVKTFRQVIELHRLELQRKEDYWNSMLASLTERNQVLLKEKNELLLQNKQEIEQLEKEKSEMSVRMSAVADQARSDAHSSVKDFEATVHQLRSEKEAAFSEVTELRAKLAAATGAAALVTTATLVGKERDREEEREEKTEAVMVRAVPLSQEEKDQLQREKDRMEGEKEGLTEERRQIADDRARMGEDRKTWLDEINKLQAEVTLWKKSSVEWEEKYKLSHTRVEELSSLQDRYHQLESQYAALTAVVMASEDCKNAAKDNITATREEKDMMDTEKKKLEKDIKKFEDDFQKKNGRKPSDTDMSDSEREMYVQLGEVSTMVDGLERKVTTLEAVQTGAVPPPPELPAAALTPSEPQVVTVEVTVPDPAVVVALERSQAERDELQDRIAQLQQQMSDLHDQLGESNAGLLEKTALVSELQAEVTALKAGTVAVTGTAALVQSGDDEKVAELRTQLEEKEKELEELRSENREMHKDIKKMVKRHAKVQSKMKEAEADKQARILLEMAARIVHEIHGKIPEAAASVEERLKAAQAELGKFTEVREKSRRADHDWVKKYKKAHGGEEPADKDRDSVGAALLQASLEAARALEEQETKIQALSILHTGTVVIREKSARRPSSAVTAVEPAATDLESQVAALDDKIIDLESENEGLREDKTRLQGKVQSLEEAVTQLEQQLASQAAVAVTSQHAEASSEEVEELQQQLDEARAALEAEQSEHAATHEKLEAMESKLAELKQQMANEQAELDVKIDKFRSLLEAKVKAREQELEDVKKRKDELEAERLANVPLDTAKEIKNLQNKIGLLEKERSSHTTSTADLEAKVKELQTKLDLSAKTVASSQQQVKDMEAKVKVAKQEKDQAIKDLSAKEKERITLERKVQVLESGRGVKVGVAAVGVKAAGGGDKALKDQVAALKRENNDLNMRLKQLERETRQTAAADTSVADKQQLKRHEKILKELERKVDMEKAKSEKLAEALKSKDEELRVALKEGGGKDAELAKLRAELAALSMEAKAGIEAATKVKALETEVKKLAEENKVLTENFNSERVLRKKYYNMVEDMKGKIRVYCRARPLSNSEKDRGNYSVLKSPDEYSVVVGTQRGPKEFQFDQIFMEDSTQEKIFEDTHNLIQSAVDGYNVCIFAYGQTGSGKTFTMIGDRDLRFPGIAPRAFDDIFRLAEENRSKFKLGVSCYMLELYNERLIDLFARPGNYDDEKLDIKKDKKGMVLVQGAVVKEATKAKELFALFEEGTKNRHTASTKMNAESSRSHLIIGIVLESTNLTTGQVVKGKLSLVDLAGSERVGKTGASAEQLKEAMSINKSLSALGDVISALSSEQSFIPYRNNKLTMLMQDSLGGNAKTLMFVNVSPADYNMDETVISLTYASRVKLITNDASKNADNKEVARLKAIIQKLKQGEAVEEEL